ncbi:MAG: polysaccharide biosynthesis tyrosine autokinase [Gemmataceae bacterium]|nr:polysaccharide biosynthesis tyrosine autokinase [Gemmataceae bacterium]
MVSRDTDRPEPAREPEPTIPLARPVAPPPIPPAPGFMGVRPLPPVQTPPGLSPMPDAMSLLKALRRRWLLACCVGVGAAVVVAGLLWVMLAQKYMAWATVQISAYEDRIGMGGRPLDLNIVMKTQAKRFTGRDVLLKALNQDKVRNLSLIKRHTPMSAITWLEGEDLKIDTQDNNELMTVSLTGDEPEELVTLVDSLTGSYLSIINGKELKERREKVKKMQAMVDGLKEKLATKVAELHALTGGRNGREPAQMMMHQMAMMQQLNEASKQLNTAQLDAERVRSRITLIKSSKKIPTLDDIPESAMVNMLQSDPYLRPKMDTVAKREKQVSLMRMNHMSPLDPTFRSIQRELVALRKEVDQHRDARRNEILERYCKKVEGEYKLAMEALDLELQPLQGQVKKWQERVDQLTRDTEGIGLTTSKIELVRSEIASQEKQLQEAERNLQTVQVEENAELRVTGCQEAVWQVKDSRRRTLMLMVVPLLALGAGALGVAYWEFRARRIHSADEVALGLGMRVVGAVPALSQASQKQFSGGEDQPYDHQLVESIDSIRTMLLRHAGSEGTQVVMVTSAAAGEGKTTLASNLALSLARAGRRTLLVDCDLRRPGLHHLFEQTLQPGFSETVLGEVDLPDAVRPTTTDENLYLLPAGQWDREVLQELARDSVRVVFERLREEFDFVVVDSHPVLPATDSLLIGQHADAVMVSVLRGVSQSPRVYAAQQRLATLGIRIFGAVVSGVSNETCASGTHYQYTAPPVAA